MFYDDKQIHTFFALFLVMQPWEVLVLRYLVIADFKAKLGIKVLFDRGLLVLGLVLLLLYMKYIFQY